jgi:acyl-CoA reductase-like NAD-dependent aldehyde dehydrogenase
MSQYTMTIDGQQVSSPGALKVINPATGEVFAEVPDCTREQLDVAMESAQRAFRTWKDDYGKRRAGMYACADALAANAEELGRLATHMQLTHDAPFTGMKWSGLGSEMGLWSIYAYTDPQTVYRTRSQVIKKGAGEAQEAW